MARILYDDTGLYIGFECFEDHAEGPRAEVRKRDGNVFGDDSVEVFLDANFDRLSYAQLAVNAVGSVWDTAFPRAKDGHKLRVREWASGARAVGSRGKGRWFLEMAVPFKNLGGPPKPGAKWGANLCRNWVHKKLAGKTEHSAVRVFGNKGFHAVDLYPTLHFVGGEDRSRRCEISVIAADITARDRTLEDRRATVVTLKPGLEADAVLHNVVVQAEVFDPAGDRVLTGEVAKIPRVQFKWRAQADVHLELPTTHAAIGVKLTVKCEEGAAEQWVSLKGWKAPARLNRHFFTPESKGNEGFASTPSLKRPCYLPSVRYEGKKAVRFMRTQAGTVEFWLRLPEGEERHSNPIPMTLLHLAPVRAKHPFNTNHRSVCVSLAHGNIYLSLNNERYQQLAAYAYKPAHKLRWKPGAWHHVACVWDLGAPAKPLPEPHIAIYVDGKPMSQMTPRKKGGPFLMRDNDAAVQIGALNTGRRPLAAFVDELRVSLAPRYRGPFTPSRTEFRWDKDTGLLGHFNGSLAFEAAKGDGAAMRIEATPGAVGSY